ncbi:hypothetical protein PPERSA_07349 [Pseudocohnilembus persalinus]|uniref:Uncharacterized protein n=1 Tax=Pseudocohnilembus persalinus TaxID=266149 RepID=A0A0V0QA57_PSEPJ|nr:hypothetical protein PPERSA_07349 [Pseudocohnilembus persalinus]|eukprot:KRW99096.1 hypothetical protein PPERSA_07349 [Pseudocohnilembus persalinus]
MSHIISSTIAEQYLLAENKEEYIKTLVQGTRERDFLEIQHLFNTEKELSEQDKKKIEEFTHKYSQGRNPASTFEFRQLLLEFTNSQDEKKQKEIIKKLQENYFKQNFNFNKPTIFAQTAQNQGKDAQKYKSELDQAIFDFENFVKEKAYTSQAFFNQIKPQALARIDPLKIDFSKDNSTQKNKYLLDSLRNIVLQGISARGDKAVEIIEKYSKTYESLYKQQNVDSSFYKHLTLEQFKKLGKKLSFLRTNFEYCSNLFQKTFEKQLEPFKKPYNDLSIDEKKKLRELSLEIRKWAQDDLHISMYSLSDQMLLKILKIDNDLEQHDEKLFIQYIENPQENYYGIFSEEHLKKVQKLEKTSNNRWIQLHHQAEHIDETNLILDYLYNLFKKEKNTQKFQKYFKTDLLNRQFALAQLHQNGEIQNVQNLLSASELESETKSRQITIVKSNKNYFKPGEEISLFVDIKNINNLMIKVFEINTENYYLKNKSSFDNSISLEGINPLDQQANIQLSENPVIIKRHKFEFQKLSQAERGIFVIEFLGNGISSRAVIRKGGLSILQKNNLSGHVLTLINENKDICIPNKEDPQTGIWLNGRFLKANGQGQVTIPFSQSQQNHQIILVHNNFAELNNITTLPEQYQFQASYLYHPETFLRANKAKIIIQPRLFINEIPCNMKLIENAEITAVLINEQNIPNTYSFKNPKLSAQEDIEIEIPVQNLINTISIKFDGKIKKLNGEFQNISHVHDINFSQNLRTEQFTNLYLSTNQQGYLLYILGKNGEPRPNMTVNIQLTHELLNKTFSETLQTNEQGQILLGKLKDIEKIEVTLYQTYEIQQIKKVWNIKNLNQVQYPTDVNLTEEDILTLPALQTEVNSVNYELFEILSNGNVLADCISNLSQKNNRLIVKGLKQGQYILNIKEYNQTINIKVIKGEYWKQNQAYIIDNNDGSFSDRTSNIDQNLKILDCQLNDKKDKVNIKLLLPENCQQKSALDMVRVHAFAYNFSTNNVNDLSDSLREIQNSQSIGTSYFGLKRSVFLNNKTLGDEICYVLERRNQKKYIGNTLEKPNILLKKTFVRDTQFDKENLSKDQEYSQGLQDRTINEQAKRSEMKKGKRGGGASNMMYQARCTSVIDNGVDLMLNFLENSCKTYTNLKPDQDGSIEISNFEGEKYSQMYLIVTNLEASVSDTFNLKQKSEQLPSFRDLRLKSNLQKFKPFSEKRGTIILRKEQKSVIKSDTENIIIDNLQQFFDIQKQVKITSHGSDNENNGYQFWSFLTDWAQFSKEKKLEKYDEFACHEINIFLYIKDKPFFEEVVKPFIANKIEKSFVDYFLLDDKQVLNQYAQTHQLSLMNYMEKCLLVSYLAKNEQKQQAQQLAASISLMARNQPLDTNLRKRLYDTVISAQSKAPVRKVQRVQEAEMRVESVQARNMSLAYQPQVQQMQQMSMAPQSRMMAKNKMAAPMMARMMDTRQEEEMCDLMSFEQEVPQQANFMSLNAQAYNDDEFSRQVEQRKEYKAGYEKLKKTKEYIERTYYEVKNPEQQKSLIGINLFWEELAHHAAQNQGNLDQFLSENFIYASKNHAEMILVLAFTDLPFQGGDFTLKAADGRDLQICAGKSNLIVFLKDITLCEFEKRGDITVSQMFFDPKDRYKYLEDDPSVKVEKEVDEFIINKVYGIQTIITNCSIAQSEFQVLVEIPEGAIPVSQIDYTKATTLSIDSYHTEKIQTFFYFPGKGKFNIIPASVSRNEKVLAYANDLGEIEVKVEKQIKKMETFTDIIKNGKQEDILQFIKEKNILNNKLFKFSDIYWLVVQDQEFFSKLVQILQERQIFDYQTWLFSIHHQNPQIFQQLLQNETFQKALITNKSKSHSLKFLKSEKTNLNSIQFFEYHPLLSQRVHKFMNEQKSTILNKQLKETYENFLQYLLEVPQLTAEQLLVWAYYLLLQERIEESINIFNKIQRNQNNCSQLQYDYMAAYLDIYQGKESNFKVAREIAKKYDNYPILSWRNLFVDLKHQLQEYDGENVEQSEQLKETEMNKNLKSGAQEEQVNFELDKKELVINYQNSSSFKLFFYEIDLEILFSRQPFLNNDKSDEFAYVKANHTENIKVNNSNLIESMRYKIPENLVNKNLYILLKYSNDVHSLTYFSADLKVSVLNNYGQVKVMDANHQPLSKVYVKCFAKDNSGNEQFYRDGYTDLRGRFDYALSSNSDIDNIQKFSLLISSEEYGSIIKEAKKPNTQGNMASTLQY